MLGDSYCPASALAPAFDALAGHDVRFADVVDEPGWLPVTPSDRLVKEYLGTPAQVIDALGDARILVVQGAPVTAEVLAATEQLELICVARGGPVNVDIGAATARRIRVVTTPGKNATAVAELTLALMMMVARQVRSGMEHVAAGGEVFVDNYEGAHWFGHELAGHTLGIIGFGQIGRRVARRAQAFEMRVLAFDPFVPLDDELDGGVEHVPLDDLLAAADFVSLHARATTENQGLIGRAQLARMRADAYLVNTARDVLVDEDALDAALRAGRLAGAALDIASPSPKGSRHRLLEHPNVILLPHIGGATLETLANGGRMAVTEIERFEAGHPPLNLANPAVLVPQGVPR